MAMKCEMWRKNGRGEVVKLLMLMKNEINEVPNTSSLYLFNTVCAHNDKSLQQLHKIF
jgi:hypothetical protein